MFHWLFFKVMDASYCQQLSSSHLICFKLSPNISRTRNQWWTPIHHLTQPSTQFLSLQHSNPSLLTNFPLPQHIDFTNILVHGHLRLHVAIILLLTFLLHSLDTFPDGTFNESAPFICTGIPHSQIFVHRYIALYQLEQVVFSLLYLFFSFSIIIYY